MRALTAALLPLLACGCAADSGPTPGPAERYLVAVDTLDLDLGHYPSWQEYCDTVYGRMGALLDEIDDPEELRKLFWKCHRIAEESGPTSQDRLQWIDVHAETPNLVMYRLAEIGTEGAAEVLVDLYVAPDAGWDAHSAEMADDAVVRCGKPALPFLELHAGERGVARLIRLIREGAKSGF